MSVPSGLPIVVETQARPTKAPLAGRSDDELATGAGAGPLLALPPHPAIISNPDTTSSVLMDVPDDDLGAVYKMLRHLHTSIHRNMTSFSSDDALWPCV
jgi:hypothetical protein